MEGNAAVPFDTDTLDWQDDDGTQLVTAAFDEPGSQIQWNGEKLEVVQTKPEPAAIDEDEAAQIRWNFEKLEVSKTPTPSLLYSDTIHRTMERLKKERKDVPAAFYDTLERDWQAETALRLKKITQWKIKPTKAEAARKEEATLSLLSAALVKKTVAVAVATTPVQPQMWQNPSATVTRKPTASTFLSLFGGSSTPPTTAVSSPAQQAAKPDTKESAETESWGWGEVASPQFNGFCSVLHDTSPRAEPTPLALPPTPVVPQATSEKRLFVRRATHASVHVAGMVQQRHNFEGKEVDAPFNKLDLLSSPALLRDADAYLSARLVSDAKKSGEATLGHIRLELSDCILTAPPHEIFIPTLHVLCKDAC